MERERLKTFLDSCVDKEGNPVPYRTYGTGDSKLLDDLLAELRKPEIRLLRQRREGKYRAIRKARTVRLRVTVLNRYDDKPYVLREEGYSSRRSLRNMQRPLDYGASLSETVPLGQRARAWAVEALAQELGIPRIRESLFLPWYPTPEHEKNKTNTERKCYESSAYPGIISDVLYTFLQIELPWNYFRVIYGSRENDIMSIFGWRLDLPPAC